MSARPPVAASPRERKAFDFDVCARCETSFRRPAPDAKTLSAITAEMRIVYRTPGGKTFLTRAGAYSRYAWEKIRKKYPCDGECTIDYTGESTLPRCNRAHLEGGDDDVKRLHARYVRWLRWHDARLRRTEVRRAS